MKTRLDQLLVDRGLATTRTRAQALVLAGRVYSGERRLEKPGMPVAADTPIDLRSDEAGEWVSRGALKLLKGLEAFEIDPAGMVAIDVGASTGGFTDVLLARGAARVHAVDVGHGQLDWRLRNDPRVHVLERVNARHLTRDMIAGEVDLVVCDASFISLRTVLPAPMGLVRQGGLLIGLIKPQFEAGRERVGKGGVVRDPQVHEAVCADVRTWLETVMGWEVLGMAQSPITGPKGNREFLIGARRTA